MLLRRRGSAQQSVPNSRKGPLTLSDVTCNKYCICNSVCGPFISTESLIKLSPVTIRYFFLKIGQPTTAYPLSGLDQFHKSKTFVKNVALHKEKS